MSASIRAIALGGACIAFPQAALAQSAPAVIAAHPAIIGAQPTPVPSPQSSPAGAANGSQSGAANGSPNQGNQGQQTAPKRNPESPQQAPAAPPKVDGLFGTFGGARKDLAKRGFTFNGHLVSEFAANATGGIPIGGTAQERGTALSSEFALGFDADIGTISHSGAGTLHALVTTRFGSSLASNVLGNLVSVQEIYGDGQTTRFTYLDFEQPLLDDKLNVRFGKINQQNDFIAGPTYWGGNLYCYFQNNNICGTPAAIPTNNGVVPAGTEGYNYYPSSMWGVRVKGSPNKNFYVQAAALQGNPIVNSSHGGAYFGFYGSTGTELPLEFGLTLRNKAGDGIGDVRFGGYYDTSNVFDYINRETSYKIPGNASNATALAALPTQFVRGRSGAYVQLDHVLEGSSLADKRGTTAFVTAEYSDPNSALISSFVDAGIVRHGTFIHRDKDTLALGFASENFNPRLQRLQLALQAAGFAVPYTSSEKAFEFNYGWQASPWLLVRPGFQYVLNPNGEEANVPPGVVVPRSALVFALTTVFSF